MLRATIKSLVARKLRLVLTALAVVLGVGFVSGTLVLTDTLNQAFDELFLNTRAGVDVVVRARSAFTPGAEGPGGGGTEERDPVPEELLEEVRGTPGVATVAGDIAGYAQFVDPATGEAITPAGAPTIGASWDPLSGLRVRRGEPPAGPGEVGVDAGTAERYGLEIGERVTLLFQGPPREFTIVGTMGVGEVDNLLGATLAVFDVETAQEVFGRSGEFDTLNVVLEPGASLPVVRQGIETQLPKGFEVITAAAAAAQQAEQVKEGLSFLKTALLVFAFVSLFVGAFIIFNTFSIIVTQRTRELGLLRALGATGRQVMVSVLVEAFITGLVAAAIGVGAGMLLAIGLQALLEGIGLDLPTTATRLLPRTVIVALAVGTLVTLAASIAPARRASRVAPVQALREAVATSGGSLRIRVVAGLAVTGVGVAALLYGLFGAASSQAQLVGVGAAFTFVGVAVLSPLVARPLAAGLGAPLRRLSVSGKLGRENAMRNPRRTASTAAALMIGLGLVSFVAVFAASLRSSASAALDEILRADFIISTTQFTPFSPEVARELEAKAELGAVSPLRQGQVKHRGKTDFLSGVDPGTIGDVANIELSAGSVSSLAQGELLVYREVAETRGYGVGDTVELQFARTGVRRLTVGGIFADNRLLGNFAISLDTYQQNFAEQLDAIVFVTAAPGVPIADARRSVNEVAARYPNVDVNDQAQFKERQAGFIDQLLALVIGLLLLAIVIALFGIVNTLGLSIYERIRELGLLRAVGMSRWQVAWMVVGESVIIAVLGAILGIAIGVLFGWAMQQALADQGISELTVPFGSLVLYMVAAGVAGVLAAVVPAIRASRIKVLEAIAYE